MKTNTKYCHNCGKKLPETANFCISCGEKQFAINAFAEPNVETYEIETQLSEENEAPAFWEKQTSKRPAADCETPVKRPETFNERVAKAVILLVCAIMMFVMAFLPIVHLNVRDWGDIFLSLEFAPIDHIVFLFDSLQNNEEHAPSFVEEWKLLNQEMVKLNTEYGGKLFEQSEYHEENMPKESTKLLRKILVLQQRMYLQNKEVSLESSVTIAGVISVLYLTSASAFLVLATVHLVFVVSKKNKKALQKIVVAFLFSAPMSLLVCYYAIYLIFSKMTVTNLSTVGIIFVLLLFLGVVLYTRLNANFEKEHLKKRVISLALLLFTFGVMFAPIINMDIQSNGHSKTVQVNTTCFDVYDEFEDAYKKEARSFKEGAYLTLRQVGELFLEDERTDRDVEREYVSICQAMVIFTTRNEWMSLEVLSLAQVPLLTVLIACFVEGLFVQNLCKIMGMGKKRKKRVSFLNIALLLLTLLYLGAAVFSLIKLNSRVDFYKNFVFAFQLGMGPVLGFAFAGALLGLMVSERKGAKSKVNVEGR